MTGSEKDAFDMLLEFLNPGANNVNMKFYKPDIKNTADVGSQLPHTSCKRGQKPKLETVDQLFMLLTWLRNGLTLALTGWLFDMALFHVILLRGLTFYTFLLGVSQYGRRWKK